MVNNCISYVDCYLLQNDTVRVVFLSKEVLIEYCRKRGIVSTDSTYDDVILKAKILTKSDKKIDYLVYTGKYPDLITNVDFDECIKFYTLDFLKDYDFDECKHTSEFDVYLVNNLPTASKL